MKTIRKFTVMLLLFEFCSTAFPQNTKLYMPKEIKQGYEKGTRSWDGKPGKNYWQNFSEYNIEAEFIPDSCKVIGQETIIYNNNSPDTLLNIVLMLKQNIYQKGGMRDYPGPAELITDGVKISSIVINSDSINLKQMGRIITIATAMQINLDNTTYIKPSTETKIEISWQLTMPKKYVLRSGAIGDSAFFIAYWFPQIVVYDDVYGWDNMFYSGITETYNDLSNFDVKIKVPGDFLVWATGEHQNMEEVYTSQFYSKVQQSKQNNSPTHLIAKENLTERDFLKTGEYHTWHFTAENVPDFSFALANKYVWDAVSVVSNNETGARTWVNVVHSPNTEMYNLVINFAGKSIEYFSNDVPGIPFPYSKHTTFEIEGSGGGMEFPMMAANGLDLDTAGLADLTAHEIAHTWFPFYVNTNEERYAWMDEGWVTVIGQQATESMGLGKAMMWLYMKQNWNTENDLPLMTTSNNLSFYALTHYYYEKSSTANKFLFEIFEENGFHNPLKTFINRWKYKHPTPYDYFFTMEDIIGEELSWFWKPWYFEFHAPDLKIEKVEQRRKQTEITVSNPGGMPVPVHLNIEFEDGSHQEIHKSAYVWKENPEQVVFNIESKQAIRKIKLGNEDIVDVNPYNNQWTEKE